MKLQNFNDLELMVGNCYGEARMVEGDWVSDIKEYLAIGCTVMNRVKSQRWGGTPKSVILQPKQFSWTNDGDPSKDAVLHFLSTKQPNKLYMDLTIYMKSVLSGKCIDFSNGANHYVALWLYEKENKQKWIENMTIVEAYGGHIFLTDGGK